MSKLRIPNEEDFEQLRRLRIDPINGIIYGVMGKPIGNIALDGYTRIHITYKGGVQRSFRKSHVIFWAYHNRWPIMEIDHKDRNKTNDRIDNLREATRSDQTGNRDCSLNRTLPTGVHLKSRMKTRPYQAIYGNKSLGYFATPEEASIKYQTYRKELQ